MNAISFDTLKLAQGLQAAGMTPGAAAGTSEAMLEAMAQADFATKAGLAEVKTELRAEIREVKAELKADIAGVRADIVAVNHRIDLLSRDLTIRLGGMLVVCFGIFFAALRFTGTH